MQPSVNTKIYDEAVERTALLRQFEEKTKGRVDVVLDGHRVRTDKLIREAQNSKQGQAALRLALEKERTKTFKEAMTVSSNSLRELVTDQISWRYQNFETAIGRIWRTNKPQRRIAEEIVLQRPLYNDKTLSAGWHGVSVSEKQRIERVIRAGIAKGQSMEEIARDVRKGNIHKITRNQSRTLTVTAMTSVAAQADHAVYEANEKALQGYQYISVLDSSTTDICIYRDGKIYPVGDYEHLPPAHYGCRSSTTPVVKSYNDLAALEGVDQIRQRNLQKLSPKQRQYYDGLTPLKESYDTWLRRQNPEIQLRHLGSNVRLELFRSGKLTVDKFVTPEGKQASLRQLRQISDPGEGHPNDSRRFAIAKQQLDSLRIGASFPDDLIQDKGLRSYLREYYKLQAGNLDGVLSLTNYRGVTIGAKKVTKGRVLSSPPTENNLVYNPLTGRYDDSRMYQPYPAVLSNSLRLVDESVDLLPRDKQLIHDLARDLTDTMSVNERAAVVENLRAVISRSRKTGEAWGNFKAVLNAQMKFDVMNVSDFIETQLRKDLNPLEKLKKDNFIDPVLGPVQLDDLHDNLINNIKKKNRWEDKEAPKLAKKLRNILDYKIPVKILRRLDDKQLQEFYLKFAHRLSLADSPDRDQLAIALGRDLYNAANYRGDRRKWFELGVRLLEDAQNKGIFELETFGVQKRRMRSRVGGRYFGQYYDTFSVNVRIVDPKIQEYSKVTRMVDVGLRTGVTSPKNRLLIREGYKTYFVKQGPGVYYDTRIPITSTDSFSSFPESAIDKDMTNALNWASSTKYKVDEDFFDFTQKLLYFKDDRGKAAYYDSLNEYREYIAGRGDAYERFKAMEWHRGKNAEFSNHPFLDHRARIYERGFIGPQSGETFRPFLATKPEKFSALEFDNLQDQVGAFLGGLSDELEGRFDSLTVLGRQRIADRWRDTLVQIGREARRGRPRDIRSILENPLVHEVEGEEQGKLFRFAIELSKIDDFLRERHKLDFDRSNTGKIKKLYKEPSSSELYSKKNLEHLSDYDISLPLEQDASSSGAQIIAMTTKNKQLAEMSNVVLTNQKRRLYDEIAALTFQDARFKEMNLRLGLTEKDLRKAAKAQNMVTFYGAGEKTGIMNVEAKLAKALGKAEDTLIVKASDRDTVLAEISARAARYKQSDPETYEGLMALRKDVADVFNKGIDPGDEIMEELFFLDPKTRDLVEKMTKTYAKVVTPKDFQTIAMIMSENLAEQVPILKDFTKYFGRLAESFFTHSKPSKSKRSVEEFLEAQLYKEQKKRPPELLKKFGFWKPDGNLSKLVYGIREKKKPKSWTNIPWVNFDGKTLEQKFTQSFEEKLVYKDKSGEWVTNILQVAQKTDPTWWDEFMNKEGKINDIVNIQKAKTAYAVNGNHSNDATIVKQFHMWGHKKGIPTSTIHDAFFNNAARMLDAKAALREIYAKTLDSNVIEDLLNEMRKRGLPRSEYLKFKEEAEVLGLIPVPGKSKIGGRIITEDDILTKEQVLEGYTESFRDNRSWYGIGP